MNKACPILKRSDLFRPGESFFIHNSKDLPEYVSKMHCHDFVEISYVLSGECKHIEGDAVYHCKKGDLYIINYMVPHSDQIVCSEPFVTYDCAFSPDFLDTTLTGMNDFSNVRSSFLFSTLHPSENTFKPFISLHHGYNEIERLLNKMLDEYTNRHKGYIDILRVYLIELLITIFRKIDSASPPAETKSYIDSALQYIHEHYDRRITLTDISYRSFISKSYFTTMFKNTTGMSFLNYLQKIRIERACELLKTTDLAIESIVLKTGFCDYKFFYNTFKKLKKCTPGEYRRLHSNTTI